jgi:hypothetical protein
MYYRYICIDRLLSGVPRAHFGMRSEFGAEISSPDPSAHQLRILEVRWKDSQAYSVDKHRQRFIRVAYSSEIALYCSGAPTTCSRIFCTIWKTVTKSPTLKPKLIVVLKKGISLSCKSVRLSRKDRRRKMRHAP